MYFQWKKYKQKKPIQTKQKTNFKTKASQKK